MHDSAAVLKLIQVPRKSLTMTGSLWLQYNPFGDLSTLLPEDDRIFNDSDGSIIAVSYEARAHGVKRCMPVP